MRGAVPDLSRISTLHYLDLSWNQLTGSIPSNKLSDSMTTVYVHKGQRAYIVNYMSRNGALRQQLYKEIDVIFKSSLLLVYVSKQKQFSDKPLEKGFDLS